MLVDVLPEAQCDDGIPATCTSPAAVSNPEYFDEDLLANTTTDEQIAHPVMRLRIQSTESTASDHDEYDRLNSPRSPMSHDSVRLKSNLGVLDMAGTGSTAVAHPMFAESVL